MSLHIGFESKMVKCLQTNLLFEFGHVDRLALQCLSQSYRYGHQLRVSKQNCTNKKVKETKRGGGMLRLYISREMKTIDKYAEGLGQNETKAKKSPYTACPQSENYKTNAQSQRLPQFTSKVIE